MAESAPTRAITWWGAFGFLLLGFLATILIAEAGVRILAPLFNLSLRAFVLEEAARQSRSALRVAEGTQIVLREADFQKPVDVVVVGDSFVFGSLVKESELFTTHLAQRMGFTVLNVGVSAQGPCAYNHMIKVTMDRLPAAPKLIIYTVFANDISEPPCESFSTPELFIWEKAYQRDERLRIRMVQERLLQHSVLYGLLKVLITHHHLNDNGNCAYRVDSEPYNIL